MTRGWAALVLLAACAAPPGPLVGDAGAPCNAAAENGGGAIGVGSPSEVELALNIGCDVAAQLVLPDEVRVDVIGPDERPVVFSALPPQVRDAGARVPFVSTKVTFTPEQPGPYSVRARFEPGVGIVQHAYVAVPVRTDAGFRLVDVEGFPEDCTRFGVLASGIPVCVTGHDLGTLVLPTRRLVGVAFALDGDTVWAAGFEPNQPELRILKIGADGTVLARSAPIDHREARLVARNGVAFGGGFQPTDALLRFVAEPAATVAVQAVVPRGQFIVGLAATDAGVIATSIDSAGKPQVIVVSGDGGVFVAPLPLAAGRQGSDEGYIWADDAVVPVSPPGAHTLAVVEVGSAGPRIRRFNATGSGATPYPLLAPHAPIGFFRHGVSAVLRVDGAELGWELFDPGPGFGPIVAATRRHAFARSLDGKTLKILDR